MPAIFNPHAFYGAARGLQDVEDRERLQTEFDLRRRALEGRLAEDEQLRPLRIEAAKHNLDLAKLNKEHLQRLHEEYNKAQEKQKRISAAWMGRNPQMMAEAIAAAYPEAGIVNPRGRFEEGAEGSQRVIFEADNAPPQVFELTEQDRKAGITDVWEKVGMTFALTGLNPVNALMERYKAYQGEQEKQREHGRALELEKLKAEERRKGEREEREWREPFEKRKLDIEADKAKAYREEREEARRQRKQENELRRAQREVDRRLAPGSSLGSFITGKFNEVDAQLRGAIMKEAERMILDEGETATKAVDSAFNNVSAAYDSALRLARKYAAGVPMVDVRDRQALERAAQRNENARNLLRVLSETERVLGYRVRTHIESQLGVPARR